MATNAQPPQGIDPATLLSMLQQMQQQMPQQQMQVQQQQFPTMEQMRSLVRDEAQAVIDSQQKGLFDNPYVKWGTVAVAAVAIGGTLYYFNERINALEAK